MQNLLVEKLEERKTDFWGFKKEPTPSYADKRQPGLNYHLPFPVESVLTPKVTKVNRMDIGFRSERDSGFT